VSFVNSLASLLEYVTGESILRTAVIRPVLEYASPVSHYSITRAQSQHLESIQKRAIHIIFSFTCGMSYPDLLFVANLNSLIDRRDKLLNILPEYV